MPKAVNTIFTRQNMWRHAVLAVALLGSSQLAYAQDGDKPLVPNLTVNIKLNSALGEKETEFYSKIAQDLISKLPRELKLAEQAAALKDLDDTYQHLNVVTYFPPTDDVETDKLIKHFKVRFVFDDTEGAKTLDEVQDIVMPKGLQKAVDDYTQNPDNIVGLKDPDTSETQQVAAITPMPDRPTMIEQMVNQNTVYEPVAPELKPAPAPAPAPVPVATPKPEPKPVVVAAVTPKPTPKPVAKPAPKPAAKKINKLRLAFDTDETNLNVAQRVEMMKFVTKLRSNQTKQPDGFVFVVRSYEGPIGVEDNLGESRLRAVTALLRQQDINVSRSRVTEIFVRTNNQQFVEVEPVY